MFENFKADIIYYNTATDFELEFNLCGCCRMHLFKDKATDKKNLLVSLARSVSRSKVIIITAPLFSEDNIMQMVASAIGTVTEVVDNAAYNITSETEINIIKGGLPLVTEDGVFGGCVVEQGPQSLVILTDNKTVRKVIMKDLLHQYIADVAARPDEPEEALVTDPDEPDQELTTAQDEDLQTPPEQALILEDGDTEDDAAQEDGALEEDAQLIMDTDESDEPEQDTPSNEPEIEGLYTDIDLDNKNPQKDDGYYYEDDFYTDEDEQKTSPFNIWLLIISIVVLLALAVLCYCIFYVPTKAGISPSAYLKDVFDTMFK